MIQGPFRWRLFFAGVMSCLALSAIAIGAALAGHGTYVPIAFVISHIYFFAHIHIYAMILLVPFYWGIIFAVVKGNKRRVFYWLTVHSAGFLLLVFLEREHFSLVEVEKGIYNVAIFFGLFFFIVLFLLRPSQGTKKEPISPK